MTTIAMTADEFAATGRDCNHLGEFLNDARWEHEAIPARGRIYIDSLYIERRPTAGWTNGTNGEWYLSRDPHDDILSDDLAHLEKLLYEWAIANEYIATPK